VRIDAEMIRGRPSTTGQLGHFLHGVPVRALARPLSSMYPATVAATISRRSLPGTGTHRQAETGPARY
jgi:hypothetical protein